MSAVAATARAGAAVDNSFATAALQPAQLSTHRKVLALGVMCLGFFIAYLGSMHGRSARRYFQQAFSNSWQSQSTVWPPTASICDG